MASVAFNVSVEESHSVLKKVLPLMSQQQVPTIPQNYLVWYDFVCEGNSELVAELQERMGKNQSFSPDVCQSLFEKYFLHELKAQVHDIQGAMRHTVDSVLAEIAGLDEDLGNFAGVLGEADSALRQTPSADDLLSLVARLAEETRSTSCAAVRSRIRCAACPTSWPSCVLRWMRCPAIRARTHLPASPTGGPSTTASSA